MINAPRCRQLKTNGLICKSPALHGEPRCYYHSRQMLRHSRFRAFAAAPVPAKPGELLPLIPVDDHDSIQLALSMVINGLATGHLEPQRAKALLYGLQIASVNAKNICTEPSNCHHLPLSTQTDPVGDDLAPSGNTVDIEHPDIAMQRKVAELRARVHDPYDEEEDDEEEDVDDEEDEDDEQEDEEPYVHEEDDSHDEDNEDDDFDDGTDYDTDDTDDEDRADDLKVFTEVNDFLRRHIASNRSRSTDPPS